MTQDIENLRKKNETEMQNKMEGQSSRLEQAEERISELEDEMVINGKLKNYWLNNSRPVKRKCKNLLTTSKDQTSESWTLKKEKRCNKKEWIIYSTK
jgi:hypothetical protein